MKYRVWQCKIVVPEGEHIPDDGPPRVAAVGAVERAGIPVLACFSGWGGALTGTEEGLVDGGTLTTTQKE
jgi:hypothetical protein